MKKKLLSILCCLCLMLPCMMLFAGCKDEPPAPQVTMMQIEETIQSKEDVVFGVYTVEEVSIYSDSTAYNYSLHTKSSLERQNIDSIDFRISEYINLNLIDEEESPYTYGFYILKFANTEAAKVCAKKYVLKNCVNKAYGNLVVVAESEISAFVFATIDELVAGLE